MGLPAVFGDHPTAQLCTFLPFLGESFLKLNSKFTRSSRKQRARSKERKEKKKQKTGDRMKTK